jgi:hypothetical protein
MAFHRDDDEERRARVEATLQRLRVPKKEPPKVSVRLKARNDRHRLRKKA